MNPRTQSNFKFERKAYGENSSPEEIQAIQNSVFIHDPQIIYFKQLPVPNPFTTNLLFDKVEQLGEQLGKYGLLIDIQESARPDAITRRAINSRFSKINEAIVHLSICTGKNFLINTAARFVIHNTNLNSISFHKTIDASIEAIKGKIDG